MTTTDNLATSAASRLRLAVFASGEGSNAENIIRHCREADPRAEVALVVCNRAGAGVIRRAEALGVECALISRDDLQNPVRMGELLDARGIDAIVLAGFLLMIPPFLIHRYPGRIINIHPSLLPRHGGKGMYGRHVHEAVIAAGDTVSGITVHLVSEACDEGHILFQASVAVEPGDTAADVERKIHALEAAHYPRVIIETLL